MIKLRLIPFVRTSLTMAALAIVTSPALAQSVNLFGATIGEPLPFSKCALVNDRVATPCMSPIASPIRVAP